MVLMVCGLLGCSLLQDFDRYSDHYSENRGDSGAPPAEAGACSNDDRDRCGPGCVACAGAARCVAGVCECAPGATRCGDVCTYLDTDPLNCRSCGATVADSSQTCAAGVAVCAGALMACKPWSFDFGGATYDVTCPTNAACIDTAHDGNHCYRYSGASVTTRVRCYSSTQVGVCVDHLCTYHPTSASGECTGPGRLECAVNTEPSDPNVRSCVDTLRDPNHCGGCNAKCAGRDELCADGVCKRYRPARVAADCGAGFRFCTLPASGATVCVAGVATCPA